jgi:hypothetical protein
VRIGSTLAYASDTVSDDDLAKLISTIGQVREGGV